MSRFREVALPLTVVGSLIVAVFVLGFTAGGHMLNTSIHQDIPTKSALINSAVDRHAAQPHKGMVPRSEYDATSKLNSAALASIQGDIRQIRDMVIALSNGP